VAQWDELDDTQRVHELKKFYGTKTLVTAANYDAVYKRLAASRFEDSPFVGLDIETSSSEESDEWIERLNTISEKSRGDKIDVLGHELTGMSMTFGFNTQHTIYMGVDHAETENITVDQCRETVELIPQSKNIIIQNRNFEFSVLYRTWGEKWMNNGWHGFIPNALDTKIGASYVDENLPKGLKFRSKHHLGYDQETYEQVTTRSGPVGKMTGGAVKKTYRKEVTPAVTEEVPDPETGEITIVEKEPAVVVDFEDRQYKMRELPARRVFDYGCDDTICTASLHTFYQIIMEMEGTWRTYLDVETLPEYLTTLAFVQGTRVSLSTLHEMEKHDNDTYDQAWSVLRTFLLQKGWEGTVCPVFDELTPAAVKEAATLLLDTEEVQFSTKRRKLNAMAEDIRDQFPDNDIASVLALMVESEDVKGVNGLVKSNFTGEPKINFGSPKQLQNLFYNVIGLPPRLFNSMTAKQREENETMRAAFKKMRQAKDGKEVQYSTEEREALVSKASTDSAAVETALAMGDGDAEVREVLKAYQHIRTVMTRRSLFYKPYKVLTHWRDGRIHPALNQAEAVTRRYSSSSPNIQQLPKLGEGGQFRKVILPHRKDAVVVSCDFAAQEIRALAWLSKDEALLSCYLGETPQDMHSLTAVSAAPLVWHEEVTYEEFRSMLESKDPAVKERAKALRGQSKTTFFGAAYGAAAPKIAQTLMVEESVAQAFLDAKDRAFPRIEEWKREVEAEAAQRGYAVTMLGARRHLTTQLNAEDKWDRARGERQVGNYAIQGSCAEQTKLAMAEMWRRGLFDGRYDVEFIATIHDECVASVHRKDVVPFLREFHDCMQTPYGGMEVPIVSSISLGPSFGEQRELGEVFDADLVQAAVDEIFGVSA
jgi:DNA polymerase I-like protein with 3'-5' exonuclease and polymerase domains